MDRLDLLDSKVQAAVRRLSSSMKFMVNALLDGVNSIIAGDCDESTLCTALDAIKQNAEGRFCDSDLMNYDEAGKALGFGTTNRVGLKRLLDEHGIREVRMNNMKVGFRRDEIMMLRGKVDAANKNKKNTRQWQTRKKH